MKKRIQRTLFGLMVVVPVLAVIFAPVSFAQSFRANDNVTVAKEETVESTLFAAGKTISIDGVVDGDVFCAGSTVIISGVVNGDVICAGQSVTISGTVNGDIRLAGESITLEGTVLGNASVAGSMFTVASTGTIEGDTQVGSARFTMNGNVGRDLTLGSEIISINGIVGRDIHAESGTFDILSNGMVGGTVSYRSEKQLTSAAGSQIKGEIKWDKYTASERKNMGVSSFVGVVALIGLSLFAFAMILVLFVPQRFKKASDLAIANWSKTMAVGLLTTLVVPFVIVFSLMTLIGVPLGILLMMAFGSMLLLSGPFAAYLLGRVILGKRTKHAVWHMATGAVIILALYLVPLINILTMMLVMWFGVGMIVRSIGYAKPRYN